MNGFAKSTGSRNMAQFITLRKGADYDAAAETVLAKVSHAALLTHAGVVHASLWQFHAGLRVYALRRCMQTITFCYFWQYIKRLLVIQS